MYEDLEYFFVARGYRWASYRMDGWRWTATQRALTPKHVCLYTVMPLFSAYRLCSYPVYILCLLLRKILIKGCRCHHQSKNVGFKTNWGFGINLEWNEFNELEFNCLFPLSCIKWQHTSITHCGFFHFGLFFFCFPPVRVHGILVSKEQLSLSEITHLIIAGEDLWKDDTHY